ncbi:hypothetical protein FG386_002583 [Cryptosporidium ryanae]|uniref:uncharacterized protein n=1 Tax=Cryptosporidium ryanae TaxID=515981 RepID=UPI00351A2797|nr:hypothetical protein FG386_002583 [Cryptosporidium ryanae]
MEDESPINSPIRALDTKDPVFDSESENENVSYSVIDVEKRERMVETFSWSPQGRGIEAVCSMPIEEFRVRVKNLCQDYFLDYKTQDFINGLRLLSSPSLHNLVVVIAVRMSLDYNVTVQQQVSALLTILKDARLITQQQIEDGLEKLIQSIDDICLDAPFSPERLESVVDCAILDGIIPENFRCRYPETFLNKLIELRNIPDSSCPEGCNISTDIKGPTNHLKTLRAFKSYIINYEEDFFSSGFKAVEVDKILQDARLFAYKTTYWNGIDWNPDSFEKPTSDDISIPSTFSFNHEFVKFVVKTSMSRNDSQRELVSSGLNLLSPSIINSVDISLGFLRILGDLDDLSLDVTNACELTTKFLSRCVVDELIPPSFITVNLILHMGGPGGTRSLKMTQEFLNRKPRSILRLQTKNIWNKKIVTEEDRIFETKLTSILNSYSSELDKRECIKSLHSLNITEREKVVKVIINYFIEKVLENNNSVNLDDNVESKTGLSLLEYLLSQGFFDEDVIMEGFNSSYEKMSELCFDSSQVHRIFDLFVKRAKERALLPSHWNVGN